jgi:hypothetical protein
MEFQTGTPPQTAMYLVDRGMQGKYYRWYDAETDVWSMCGSDMTEALSFVGRPSPVGFFPWVGPMTGPRFNPTTGVSDPEVKTPKVAKVKPAARKMARQRTGAPIKMILDGNTKNPPLLPMLQRCSIIVGNIASSLSENPSILFVGNCSSSSKSSFICINFPLLILQ